MLPSNLLRTKISRGKIRPAYVALDADSLALAERVTGAYRKGIGKRKEELLEGLKEIEDAGYDFKLVRGLSTLLERRSTFEALSEGLNPVEARKAVFREASRARASSAGEKKAVLQRVSAELGVSPEALERTLFSDSDDELILRDFKPFTNPDTLLKYYNLSVAQTLLFKSLRVEFSASGNWKNIFRNIKWLGLIYSVERDAAKEGGGGEQFRVSLDGPLSLFKMTERYGTSIAKLLPQITTAGSWNIKAEILARSRGGKVYEFEADSAELEGLMTDARWDGYDEEEKSGRLQKKVQAGPLLFDSSTEEKFSRSFLSYGTGWTLKREPEPLVAGTHVLIPDFSFEKDGMKKVYLEVVGFWTPQYLERKVAKLSQVTSSGAVDMIIAADESLACSKLERLKGKALVVYYKKEVPLKPIIEHLREMESLVISRQVEKLKSEGGWDTIVLKGDVVSIEDIASQKGATVASAKIALQGFKPEGYVRVGDRFISRVKLDEIDEKLRGIERLTDALKVIEASGVKKDTDGVLDVLGYTSTWDGLDMDKVKISKTTTTVRRD